MLDRCTNCDALLDVSGCSPLTETVCPDCSALIKVLREFHHFVLLSQLGQGGAGTVYRAFDETLERDVALKLLRNERTRDAEFIEGLEREALITASMNHPHVVKVFSTGRKNGFYYITMEIVGGGSLAQRINRQGRLPEAAVASIGIQLAEGLQAAWQRGLLHRDVKPGNILFSDQGAAKVADFGLALPISRTLESAEESGDVWGTPEYMAPEKLLGQKEDVQSDIYSVGCTLYHCLVGAPPLDLEVVKSVIKRQTAHPIPNIQNVAPQVSGAMAFVINRCLEVNPEKRYQDYGNLIEHLHYARDQSTATEAKGRAASSTRDAASAAAGSAGPKPWSWVAAAVIVGAAATWFIIALLQNAGKQRPTAAVQASPTPTQRPAQLPQIAPQSNFARQISELTPAGYWRLHESRGPMAVDSSGYLRNGFYRSAVKLRSPDIAVLPFTGFAAGELPALFTGEEDSFVALPPLFLNSVGVTFTIWIYPSNPVQARSAGLIFCRDGIGTTSGLQYDRDGVKLGYNWNDELKTYIWNSGLAAPANEWSFVALVVTAEDATLYLDNAEGQRVANHKCPHAPSAFNGETRIGNDAYSKDRTFKGHLCEAAVFRQALTADQIATLYKAAQPETR